MAEVQDRTGKKLKKEIYEISRHYKLLKTEMLDGIKLCGNARFCRKKDQCYCHFGANNCAN